MQAVYYAILGGRVVVFNYPTRVAPEQSAEIDRWPRRSRVFLRQFHNVQHRKAIRGYWASKKSMTNRSFRSLFRPPFRGRARPRPRRKSNTLTLSRADFVWIYWKNKKNRGTRRLTDITKPHRNKIEPRTCFRCLRLPAIRILHRIGGHILNKLSVTRFTSVMCVTWPKIVSDNEFCVFFSVVVFPISREIRSVLKIFQFEKFLIKWLLEVDWFTRDDSTLIIINF